MSKKQLTDVQREALKLRNEGMGLVGIAEELDVTKSTVHQWVQKGLKTLPKEEIDREYPNLALATHGFERNTNRLEAMGILEGALKELGVNPQGRKMIKQRLFMKHKAPEGKASLRETLDLMEDRIFRALQYMDDFVLSTSSAKDLALTVGILVEKMQLLKGLPTEIIDVNDRRKLNELIPLVLKDAKRRGLIIDVDSEGRANVVS